MQISHATKKFSPIFYFMELPHLYQNAQFWLQILLHHFCSQGSGLADCDGCIFELKSFVDTLQVVSSGLKIHHIWILFVSIGDYLKKFSHMIQLWQVTLTLLVSTTNCERRFSIQNHIILLIDML